MKFNRVFSVVLVSGRFKATRLAQGRAEKSHARRVSGRNLKKKGEPDAARVE